MGFQKMKVQKIPPGGGGGGGLLVAKGLSCYRMSFDYRGSMNENQKALGVKG